MELSIQVDGRKIKILRKRRALTQTELGSTVMKQEGVKPISLRTIQKIENADAILLVYDYSSNSYSI